MIRLFPVVAYVFFFLLRDVSRLESDVIRFKSDVSRLESELLRLEALLTDVDVRTSTGICIPST